MLGARAFDLYHKSRNDQQERYRAGISTSLLDHEPNSMLIKLGSISSIGFAKIFA